MRVLRALAWGLLVVVTAAAALLLALVLFVRSEAGRRVIVSIALPKIREQLTGRVEVGRLEGNVIRNIILYDIAVYDVEGGEAVRVKRLSLRWSPLALATRRRVHVNEARAEGVRVRARGLRDGRLNLAALAKPTDGEPFKLEVAVEHALADGEVEWR